MDMFGMGFVAVMTVGLVNFITMLKPTLDSRAKFAISVACAFALTFVPKDVGVIILDKSKQALEAALFASGSYKLLSKAGGN